jgi:hypothetical protein
LHLSISSTYKISFSVSKRGGIVQLRPTLPISFLREITPVKCIILESESGMSK